jgi:hypothetical protein
MINDGTITNKYDDDENKGYCTNDANAYDNHNKDI